MGNFISYTKRAVVGLMVPLLIAACQSSSMTSKHALETADKPTITSAAAVQAADKTRLIESYGKAPMSFEANQGQTDTKVKYFARGMGYGLYLTQNEIVLALYQADASSSKTPEHSGDTATKEAKPGKTAVLRMQLSGANKQAKLSSLDEQPGHINYLKGNDPKQWQKDVPSFAKVKYDSVYPGIDLVYYGNQRELEFDFVVKPGADPKQIRMRFTGNEDMKIDADGNLIISTENGDVMHKAPLVYQRN
ncbi:MAG: hypothetical protein Q9M30_00510, partial [Mariprofundaceae bacterium]|nr:hypothetical protein [Mariprofundaceae bacterium]